MAAARLLYRGKLSPNVYVHFLMMQHFFFFFTITFQNTMTVGPQALLWEPVLWDLQKRQDRQLMLRDEKLVKQKCNGCLRRPTWHDDIREAQFPGDRHATGEKDHVLPS